MDSGAGANVIYTGTYSKPYGPGVRVGFGILPAAIFKVVERIKGNHDFGTANLLQQLLARALETGLYDRHVAKIEKRYGEKARVMKQARLPEGISAGVNSKIFRAALKNDVLYVPGELCYADDPSRPKPDNGMRISFGSASEENIREGIKRLGKVLKKIKL